jgi:hypothetical protein
VVGLGGLEPPTSRLSGVRSNQLSYRPELKNEHLDHLKITHFVVHNPYHKITGSKPIPHMIVVKDQNDPSKLNNSSKRG